MRPNFKFELIRTKDSKDFFRDTPYNGMFPTL